VSDYRLAHVFFDEGGCLFFGGATNLPDQDDDLGGRILLKGCQQLGVAYSLDWISAHTDAGRLPVSTVAEHEGDLVGQRAAAAHHSYGARLEYDARKNSNQAFSRCNHARAVGTNQSRSFSLYFGNELGRVLGWNAFGDQNDQCDAGIQCFESGIESQIRWHEYARAGCTGGINGFAHRVEHRYAVNFLAAFTGSNTGDYFGSVVNHPAGMSGAHLTGGALHDYFGVFIYQNHVRYLLVLAGATLRLPCRLDLSLLFPAAASLPDRGASPARVQAAPPAATGVVDLSTASLTAESRSG